VSCSNLKCWALTLLALAIAPLCTLVHGQKELNISLAVAQVPPSLGDAKRSSGDGLMYMRPCMLLPRSLYGHCIFTTKTASSTALSGDLCGQPHAAVCGQCAGFAGYLQRHPAAL
jgi:hypothetical protein